MWDSTIGGKKIEEAYIQTSSGLRKVSDFYNMTTGGLKRWSCDGSIVAPGKMTSKVIIHLPADYVIDGPRVSKRTLCDTIVFTFGEEVISGDVTFKSFKGLFGFKVYENGITTADGDVYNGFIWYFGCESESYKAASASQTRSYLDVGFYNSDKLITSFIITENTGTVSQGAWIPLHKARWYSCGTARKTSTVSGQVMLLHNDLWIPLNYIFASGAGANHVRLSRYEDATCSQNARSEEELSNIEYEDAEWYVPES